MQKLKRLKRAKKSRSRIERQGAERLTVHRTPRHMYAQIFTADGSKVLSNASTLQASIQSDIKNTGNIKAAEAVGKIIAEQAQKAGITTVAFDRSGFKYHGRVKALADAAREAGLKF